jgi:hypothetical protein
MPSPPKQGKRPKTLVTVDLMVEETPRWAAAPAGSSRVLGACVAQAAQSSGTWITDTLATASASRAGPSDTRRSTRVRGAVASAPVASGSGEADRDDYRPGGLNVDYEDLFAEARRSLSRSCCGCALFFAFPCLFLAGAYCHSATHMVDTWMPC